MSSISELRDKVSDLENRIVILEHALVIALNKTNVQDLGSELVRVPDEDDFENRTPIGYKQRKKK